MQMLRMNYAEVPRRISESDQMNAAFDIRSLDNKRTVLHAQSADPFYTYERVPWTLEIRKEVWCSTDAQFYLVFLGVFFVFSNTSDVMTVQM